MNFPPLKIKSKTNKKKLLKGKEKRKTGF